ncbi:neuropeptide SIFamide receptor-like [Macrosteles quadrilineatus]|uniref:neuropeptide SIFamide receptor-like n=1 Tax=Macrosteles quadrilineatus TaxID=74068 RepID=UPI0023E0CBDD|nr:neuropeptide SIFamide receptor-like [Macrosteles quadrilineatus]
MNETPEDLETLRYPVPVTVFLVVAYSAVFVVGVTGNCLVVTVVYRSPRMRSPTNLFIANLACADLLVNVICLPFTLISNVMAAWTMGWLLCKTIPYLQGVSVNASINTLVAISVERCLAICYPLRWQMTLQACRSAVIFIWVFSFTITLPWAVFFKLQTPYEGSDFETCRESWPTPYSENVYFVVANLVMCYLLPLCLISVCYFLIWRRVCCRTLPGEQHGNGNHLIHRSKVKVIKMLLVVIILFACSWLPLYVIFTRIKLGGDVSPGGVEEVLIVNLLPFAQWLGASNSCINPILYAFFNRKFRVGFRAILHSGSCCTPLYYDPCSDIRTLSGKDSVMIRSTIRKPLRGSKNRMTISSGTSLLTKPLCKDINIRTMSLRTPVSNVRRMSVSADNINKEDVKNRHGTFV